MPIYEFVCNSCGSEFEQILSFSDTHVPACNRCQSDQVVRRVSRPAIHFKGSGWYITDSKKSSEKKNGANESGSSETKSSESKSSETKSSDAPAGEKKTEAGSDTAKAEPVKAAAD